MFDSREACTYTTYTGREVGKLQIIKTQMFIVALFIIAKSWKQRCPSVSKWVKYGTSREWSIIQY